MGATSLFHIGDNVELWRVLAHLSLLVTVLLVFGGALQYVERYIARYDKYYHMLQKVYRELMIFGFTSLVLKVLMEVAPINHHSKTMVAFQVADHVVFSFAIALVLQTTCIFLQLGKYSRRAHQAELISTQDLLTDLDKQETKHMDSWVPPTTFFTTYRRNLVNTCTIANKNIVRYRVLRHYFLRQFGLPQLFPFSKYIRRAQANQISHMIDVRPSMWLLILAVAWGICGFSTALNHVKLVKILVMASWALVLLHCLVLLYLRQCVHRLLEIAGYSTDKHDLSIDLARIADEELGAWESETAESALDTMTRVHELQEEVERDQKSKWWQGHVLASIYNRVFHIKTHAMDPPWDLQLPPNLPVRFFSLNVWHGVVIVLLTLNGFFMALFVQCALYNLNGIYEGFVLVKVLSVALPMLVNTLGFQQYIFRDYTLLCSILQLDAHTLGNVTKYFIEMVELQSRFAISVLQCLTDNGLLIADLETIVHSADFHHSGLLEIDDLRAILASIGFTLTRFRFTSVMNMLFDLKGASVEYVQLFQLLVLVQHDHESFELKPSSNLSPTFELPSLPHFAVLAQSNQTIDIADSDFAFLRAASPIVRRVPTPTHQACKFETHMRKSMLQRSYTNQFTGSSSRALHYMYNIRQLTQIQEEPEASIV